MPSRTGRGTFTITSRWNDLAVDVSEGESEDGLAIIQRGLDGRDSQKWRVEAVDKGRGWYKIVNVDSGKALDIKDGSKEDRAILIQRQSLDSKTQHWRIDEDKDGSYKIVSRWSGKAIDIPFGSRDQGTTLELCEDNNQLNQRSGVQEGGIAHVDRGRPERPARPWDFGHRRSRDGRGMT